MRRTLAIAWMTCAFAFVATAFLPLFGLCALFDLTRGGSWIATRTLVFVFWYLACEIAGVLSALIVRIAGAASPHEARNLERNHALARSWLEVVGRLSLATFGVRVRLDDDAPTFGDRPLVVISRRVSRCDALLAAMVVSAPLGIHWHHILGRELRWRPFVDIVGGRLPNVFVRRESSLGARDLARIAAVARSLGPGDAILVHAERERFSAARKARAVSRLREQGRDRAAREATWLRHLMPPRTDILDAILEAAPDADVVFLAHTGLEATTSFVRVLRGGLAGKTIHARRKVVSWLDVPQGREARHAWIMKRWREMDEYIDSHQPRRHRRPRLFVVPADAAR